MTAKGPTAHSRFSTRQRGPANDVFRSSTSGTDPVGGDERVDEAAVVAGISPMEPSEARVWQRGGECVSASVDSRPGQLAELVDESGLYAASAARWPANPDVRPKSRAASTAAMGVF